MSYTDIDVELISAVADVARIQGRIANSKELAESLREEDIEAHARLGFVFMQHYAPVRL
jgi:hypothetical protein